MYVLLSYASGARQNTYIHVVYEEIYQILKQSKTQSELTCRLSESVTQLYYNFVSVPECGMSWLIHPGW